MPGSFFDTNVLLYLGSGDAAKAQRAEDLLARGGTISVQVLNETANVGRRKMHLAWPDVHSLLDTLKRLLRVVPLTVETHERGLALAERYGLSTYDALIVAAASIAACDTVWSEDMQDGLRIDDELVISNPFRNGDGALA